MSQYPFMNLSYKTKSGLTVKLGDRVLVADGGINPLAFVWMIEDSSDGKTVKVILVNELRNLLNVYATGQRQAPFKSGKTGYYHIDDGVSHGLVFSLIEGLNDEQMRAEYVKLKAWHDRHGATGGTDDSSISVDPGTIPYPDWQSSGGKPGATGEPVVVDGSGQPVGEQGGGKETGQGEITRHPADTREPFGEITKDEKQEYQRTHPGEEIRKGPYTDPSEVTKKK
jgi:hypothetical protein